MNAIAKTASPQWVRRIILVAAVGVALRMIVSLGVLRSMPQMEDGPSYSRQALSLINGSMGYYYFPPGTSIFAVPVYSLFGASRVSTHLLGFLLTSAFLLVGIWFSVVVLGWGKATFIAAGLLAFYPHSVMSATQLNSEPLTAALLTGAAGLTIKSATKWSWRRWSGVSLCLAGAMLTRPASLAVLAAIGVGVAVLWKQRRLGAAVIASGGAITIGVLALSAYPFMVHNATMGQGWTISTNNEYNVFIANTPHTPDYKTGQFGQRSLDQLPAEARSYVVAVLQVDDPSLANRGQRAAMRNAAAHYIGEHPVRTLYRMSNRARGFWGMDYTAARDIQEAYELSNTASLPLLALEGGGYLLVVVLAISAAFLAPAESRRHWPIVLGFVAAIMLPYLFAFALAKYHLPVLPLLMPIAAVGGLSLVNDFRSSSRRLARSGLWWSTIAVVVAVQVEHVVNLTQLR